MIDPTHLKELIVDPTLKHLGMYSPSGSNIMVGTCAQESHMGKYLMQIDGEGNPKGPALGLWQMEPGDTGHDDIWKTYLNRADKNALKVLVYDICITGDAREMIYNMSYACAMARIKYWRDPEPLPHPDDIEGLAKVWKRVYNTEQGKGTVEEFIENYHRYVLQEK